MGVGEGVRIFFWIMGESSLCIKTQDLAKLS